MNTTAATTRTSPQTLRARMVNQIKDWQFGLPLSAEVERALRKVPRHRFVPNALVEEAYDDGFVVTKQAPDGAALSGASAPWLVADMLEQLHVSPGSQVLEIGAGTGYNAALLAELVGETGEVTTVDIDPEVTAQARRALNATGHRRVRVVTRDGVLGVEEHGAYDGIIVTVGAWDIPPAWWQQLRQGGRLVVPLRWRGQSRSIGFTYQDGALWADSVVLCGFVPLVGQAGECSGVIDTHGNVSLTWDTDQNIDPARLHGVLNQPPTTIWTGVHVGHNEPFDGIWLRLTATEPGTCRLTAEPTAVQSGLCTPGTPSRNPAIVEGESIAYFTFHEDHTATEKRWELGAIGHGPTGGALAERICEQIRTWSANRTAQPAITVHPIRPDNRQPAYTITKRHTGLTITY